MTAREDLHAKAARLAATPVAAGAVAVRGDSADRLVVDVLGTHVCDCPAAAHRQPCSHVVAATRGAPTMSDELEHRRPDDLARHYGHLDGIRPRLRELGRIRIGTQVTSGGRSRPTALDTFRLTSASRPLVDAAAALYGGTVGPWAPPDGPAQWEVVTDADTLPCAFPPGVDVLDQAFELWSAGGCQRRCDGTYEELAGVDCLCPPAGRDRAAAAADGRACAPTSRLNVLLPDLPDLGVWRLEAHGYYAARELAGAAAMIDHSRRSGRILEARLRIDHRTIRRPDEPRKDFVVPVVELPVTVSQLLDAAGTATLTAGHDTAGHDTADAAGELEHPPPAPPPLQAPAAAPPSATSGDGPPEDRNVQAEEVLHRLEAGGVSGQAFHALLAARYRGAVHIDQLTDDEVAGLHRVTATADGITRLAAAAAADLAAGER